MRGRAADQTQGLRDAELPVLLPTDSGSLQGVIAQLEVSCWMTLCGNPERVKGVFGLP